MVFEPEWVSAIANLITAFGIFFVGRQFSLSKQQQKKQTEIHIVELHIHFQSEMRAIQKMFGAGINKGDWIPSKREERALRLYWYLVFDEWYTCKYVSKEEQLNALWDRYRCGAISALKNKKFLDDIDDMFKQKAYFFGLREQFKLEINAMKAEAIELKRMDSNS